MMTDRFSLPGRRSLLLLLLPAFLVLIGCQETAGGLGNANLAIVQAPDMPVSILAVDGIPEGINASMLDKLSAAATQRGMTLVEADQKPQYQIKGYFAAAPGANGTDLSYVWDVQNSKTTTSERVEGSATSPARPANAWDVLDESTQTALAGQSMNALAAYLGRGAAASE
jgi:hypothetical protein